MSEKPKLKFDIPFTLPPKRTAKEWRELMRLKQRQYETINFEIMGKRGFNTSGTGD